MLLKAKGNENNKTFSIQFVKPEEKANQINMAQMHWRIKTDTVLHSQLPIQNYELF